MGTDAEWEKWGQQDPYFGVLTDEGYRSANIDEAAKERFFESGKTHIDWVLGVIRRHFKADFRPKRSLDFGCGAGRLVVPLAAISERVVGVDVSVSMLREAEVNCRQRSIGNVELIQSDQEPLLTEGSFDFVHSFIVLQHIPPQRGMLIVERLVRLLAEGGVGAVHITYAKPYLEDPLAMPEPDRGFLHGLRRLKNRLVNRRVPPPSNEDPEMQMNIYNLNAVLYLLQTLGVTEVHLEYTDHGGEFGTMIYFGRRLPGIEAIPGN